MKLCFLIASLNPGGAERVASLLCNQWSSDHEVHIITSSNDAKPHFALNPSIHMHSLDTPISTTLSIPQRAFKLINKIKRLRSLLKQLQPNALISFMVESNVLASLASKGLDHKLILSERTHPGHFRNPMLDNTLNNYSKWLNIDLSLLFNKWLRKKFYKQANAVIVQTQDIANWFTNHINIPCEIIENPIDLTVFSSSPSSDNQTISSIGRMTFEKGHDLLINAFIAIAKNHPEWNLKLYGEGPLRPELENIAKNSPHSHQIHFMGITHDSPSILNATDVFVLPSRIEGFPNILLEALSSGCSVLSTHYPGFPNYLSNNLILCLFNNAQSMSEQLSTLLNNKELRTRLKQSAPSSTQHLDLPKIANKWISIIESK